MGTIWQAMRRAALGLALIAVTSGILLLSDLGQRRTAVSSPAAKGRVFKAAVVTMSPDVGTQLCVAGLIDGLRAEGFEEGRNLEVRRSDAQGEMSNIPAMLENFDSSDADVILTVTTPCLTGACNGVKHKPVVFTCVTDPVAAGAGKSRTDHLAFVTGVGSFPPVERVLETMRKVIPAIRAVGVVYNPAEANSVKEISVARPVYQAHGVRLEEVAITSSAEVLQAVQILAARDIQVVLVPSDNTAEDGYEGAVKGARDAGLPLFIEDCDALDRGGLGCIGVGARPAGLAAGRLAGRILAGANPKDLPMEEVAVEEIGFSAKEAARMGIRIPDEFASKVRGDR